MNNMESHSLNRNSTINMASIFNHMQTRVPSCQDKDLFTDSKGDLYIQFLKPEQIKSTFFTEQRGLSFPDKDSVVALLGDDLLTPA